jgi:nucleoside-diphosphate-sugar epimerase
MLEEPGAVMALMAETRPDIVIHLAAQAAGPGFQGGEPLALEADVVVVGHPVQPDDLVPVREPVMALMAETRPDIVIHLAAQAGVRYSLDHPASYVSSNLVGTLDVERRHRPVGLVERHRAVAAIGRGGRGEQEVARPDIVIHLAAQAGVRYSLDHPASYVSSNLVGTFQASAPSRRRAPPASRRGR